MEETLAYNALVVRVDQLNHSDTAIYIKDTVYTSNYIKYYFFLLEYKHNNICLEVQV